MSHHHARKNQEKKETKGEEILLPSRMIAHQQFSDIVRHSKIASRFQKHHELYEKMKQQSSGERGKEKRTKEEILLMYFEKERRDTKKKMKKKRKT